MFCTRCGTTMMPEQRFCPSCGAAAGAGSVPPQQTVAFQVPAGCSAQTGRWISAGWALMTGRVGTLMLISLLMVVVSGAVPFLLQGAMMCGMYMVCWRVVEGGRADVGDLFKGFSFFLPSLLASLLIGVFTFLGVLACLPGGRAGGGRCVPVHLPVHH